MTGARPLLEIAGVTKRFGPVTAVDGVSLALEENEFFALLDPAVAARRPCCASSPVSRRPMKVISGSTGRAWPAYVPTDGRST